ncbi:hypothetical protein [Lentisphaera marina]|uniref:hypothetical protein n=1 Tax=Lentisphaera marina TaxID=1111041 RepID=UPI003B6774FD
MVSSWYMAIDDLDGKFFDYLGADNNYELWTGRLKDYIADDALLICPETSVVEESSGGIIGTAKTAWREGRRATKSPWDMSSYAYNGSLFPYTGTPSYHTHPSDYDTYKKLTDVSSPNETPVIGDAWWRNTADMSNTLTRLIPTNLSAPRSGDYSGNSINRFITNRHGKKTVMSFVDGHAKSLSFRDLYRQQWFEDYDKDIPVVNHP